MSSNNVIDHRLNCFAEIKYYFSLQVDIMNVGYYLPSFLDIVLRKLAAYNGIVSTVSMIGNQL